jgi:hypothetical protein
MAIKVERATMKNLLLTFYRKVNQYTVTVGLGSSKLVAQPTENVESIVVTYPRSEKVAVLGLRYSSRNISSRQRRNAGVLFTRVRGTMQ